MRKPSTKIYLLIIILSSIVTHFLFFGQSRETVFDEVHFGKFISGYFTHEYFFDIHPPLGKLMISGMGYLAGFQPGFSFAKIGDEFPDNAYLWLRLLPTVAGTLLPIVIYFLILQMGLSRLAAFTGGMLVVLENALLVQSQFILLDSFLLMFGFSALLFYFIYRNDKNGKNSPVPSGHDRNEMELTNSNGRIHYLALAGIFGALAVSVKWTGATFVAVIIIMEAARCRFWVRSYLKTTFIKIALSLVVLPFIIYFLIFALHFSLLSKSGPGDAFMTPKFRKTLIGSTDSKNPDIKPLNTFQKFNELNLQMYKSNATLTAGHPYSSKWYTWPFMIRPIYYWNEASAASGSQLTASSDRIESRIYFLGNPVIWWVSTVAIAYLLVNLLGSTIKNLREKTWIWDKTQVFLTFAFLLNILPFIVIKRAMFLYHYLVGLIFAVIALVFLIDQTKNKKRIFIILLATSLATFIFFAPLTYGLPLTEKAYNARVWLKSWL